MAKAISRLQISKGREKFWATLLSALERVGKNHHWLERFVHDSRTTLDLAEETGRLVLTEEALLQLCVELRLKDHVRDLLLYRAGFLKEDIWLEEFLKWIDEGNGQDE